MTLRAIAPRQSGKAPPLLLLVWELSLHRLEVRPLRGDTLLDDRRVLRGGRVTTLALEVLRDVRPVRPDIDAVLLAVVHLVEGEEAAADSHADQVDAFLRNRFPSCRAGREHHEEPETLHVARDSQLAEKVVAVRDRERRRVRNAVRDHDRHHVFLALGFSARSRARHCALRSRARALPAGVAVDLVVVADVEDVLVPLGRGGDRRHADVVCSAVTRPADGRVIFAIELVDDGDAGRVCRRARERRGGRRHAVSARRKCSRRDDSAARWNHHVRPDLGHRFVEPLEADRHSASGAVRVAGPEEHVHVRRFDHRSAHTVTSCHTGSPALARAASSSMIFSTTAGVTSPPPRPTR